METLNEGKIVDFNKLLLDIVESDKASPRTRRNAAMTLHCLDNMHACLCADHLPPEEATKTTGEAVFDMTKCTGRRLATPKQLPES